KSFLHSVVLLLLHSSVKYVSYDLLQRGLLLWSCFLPALLFSQMIHFCRLPIQLLFVKFLSVDEPVRYLISLFQLSFFEWLFISLRVFYIYFIFFFMLFNSFLYFLLVFFSLFLDYAVLQNSGVGNQQI